MKNNVLMNYGISFKMDNISQHIYKKFKNYYYCTKIYTKQEYIETEKSKGSSGKKSSHDLIDKKCIGTYRISKYNEEKEIKIYFYIYINMKKKFKRKYNSFFGYIEKWNKSISFNDKCGILLRNLKNGYRLHKSNCYRRKMINAQ